VKVSLTDKLSGGSRRVAMICFGDVRQPQTNGYTLRCWTLAKKLAANGGRVTIFQFSSTDGHTTREGIDICSLAVRHEQPSRSRLAKLLSFDPFRELRFPFESYRTLARLRDKLESFDVCYIEGCLLLGPFAFIKRLGKPLVLDTHCINKDVALKFRARHKVAGTLRVWVWHWLEQTLIRRADLVIAISEPDRTFITKHYGVSADSISLLPHEVATAQPERFAAEARSLRAQLLRGFKKVACFVGDLGAIQNKDSERYIRETLAPDTPQVHYVLVGNNPDKLPDQPNVTYTGFVEMLDPYILAADFCIAPVVIGSGVKTKVLDYIKYEKPIVATPVAMEGIERYARSQVHEIADFSTGVKQLAEASA